MPRLQHRAIFGNAILSLARLLERHGIYAFHADEDAVDSGTTGLVDETLDLVRHRIDLRDDLDREAFVFAHPDQPIEDRFPLAVARQVIVRDEKVVHALRDIRADQSLDVIGAAHA